MLDNVPTHVRPELVWNHDLATFVSELDDPYASYGRLHDGPDVVWAPLAMRGRAGWLVTRYELMAEIMMDPERFSSAEGFDVCDLLGVDWRLSPLEIDPPRHRALRMVLHPWFQPAALGKIEAMVREVARRLLAEIKDDGGCEFVGAFSSPFPSNIFLTILGLPQESRLQFLDWENAFIHSPIVEERVTAIRTIRSYLEDYMQARRGDLRDDLVDVILTAQVDGRPLDQGEIMGMCMNLYLGGLDTITSSLGWYFRHLALDPALQARLRANPSEIPAAIDDMLRAYGVVTTSRTVIRDLEFHGVAMKAGDRILLPTQLAGRDSRQFSQPEVVDPARKPRHLTLGTGIHNCLGAHLARREIKIAFEEWLARFENIRIPDGETAELSTSGVWAVSRLPLVWG